MWKNKRREGVIGISNKYVRLFIFLPFILLYHPSLDKITVIKAKKIFSILETCRLMTSGDRQEALRYLNKCREDCNRIVKGTRYHY